MLRISCTEHKTNVCHAARKCIQSEISWHNWSTDIEAEVLYFGHIVRAQNLATSWVEVEDLEDNDPLGPGSATYTSKIEQARGVY